MRHREAIQVYLYRLVHGEEKGIVALIILLLLRLSSLLYGFGVMVKLHFYKWGILARHKLPCRVISLGNITVGGTGKTPTAQVLASTIRDMGYRVVILNRGYRANWKGQVGLVSDGHKIYMTANEAGDEAFLLAKNLPGVSVVIGKNRSTTGEYAVKRLNAEVIILDDGYQHWRLDRDLDIVLIDTLNVFGNNFLLPRGTLREPLMNLDRANVFLLTKADQSTDDARDGIKETLARYNPGALIIESIHSPQYLVEIADWYKGIRTKNLSIDELKGKNVLAFSAIGNPSSFEQTIEDIGAVLIDKVRYPDHHDYTMAEMQWVMQKAVDQGSSALVTTDKDAVKIPSEFIYSDRALPVYILGIEVKFTEGFQEIREIINQCTSENGKKLPEV